MVMVSMAAAAATRVLSANMMVQPTGAGRSPVWRGRFT